ncbi:MAG: hypothetical protein KCHDKBKB_01055 [Elusimicrobia bacterium]|nr:hypothetical protein [Elusimicrobiota bacterium]
MGGPYITIEMFQKLLERWLKGEPFYGTIELECENNQIYRVIKRRTMKRADVDKVLARS